jgi:D-threo-aldose 1-dehydrogenase
MMDDAVEGGVRMERLGMGGAPLGNLFKAVSEADAQASLEAAWQAGIRHFDTAPHYGAGLSEHRMGTAMRHWPRGAFSLSTKVGRMLEPDPAAPDLAEGFAGALPFRRRTDYSGPGALRSIEDSLQRLGLSRIDTVYIHDVSEDWHGAAWTQRMDEAMQGAARALTDLKRQGVIRAWGLGVNMVEPCLAALERSEPDVFLIAGRYTLLDHTALAKLFPACAARGVRCVLGGPYNSGLLAGGTTFNYETAPPDIAARAQAIAAVCRRHGVDTKAAALQFCAAHPQVAAVIPGARNAAEVVENVAMMNAAIPGQLWRDLRADGFVPDAAPTPRDG